MSRFEKWCMLWSTILTALTGIAYLWMKYMMEPIDEFSVINHPFQPTLLKAHILVAPLLVFAAGLIAVRHIWRHYRTATVSGRRSGLSAAISIIPMILTGYLIQAVTSERALSYVAYSHIAVGLIFSVALLIHAIIFTLNQKAIREARRMQRNTSPRVVRGHRRPSREGHPPEERGMIGRG